MEFFQLLAGLSIFLLALSNLETGLSKASGRTFEIILSRFTKNHFLSVVTGIVTTAILQSSSVVTLMTLAFVGASILPFSNALGIVIGANLGTTFTGWIVSTIGFKLNLESFIFPLLSVGCISFFLPFHYKKLKNLFLAIFSFGLLLYGLDLMKESMSFVSQVVSVEILKEMGLGVYFLFGIIFTAIIQSSSATMMITLAALNQGIIHLDGACALVIGADLGTTGTTILGAIGGSVDKKRIAAAHVCFNIVTDLLALLFIYPLIRFSHFIVGSGDDLYTLVFFHSSFNLIGVFVFFPFLRHFQAFLIKLLPSEKRRNFLNLDTLFAPTAQLSALKDSLVVLKKNVGSFLLNLGDDEKKMHSYEDIKTLADEIFLFILKIREHKLNPEEHEQVSNMNIALNELLNSLKDAKSVEHNMKNFNENIDPKKKELYFREKKIITEIIRDEDNNYSSWKLSIQASKLSNEDFIVDLVKASHSFSGVATFFNVNREVHSSLESYINAQKLLY